MISRNGFTFYRSYYDAILELDPKDQLKVLLAIISYALDGAEPDLKGVSKAMFALIRPTLDKSRKMAEGGAKSTKSPDKGDDKVDIRSDKGQDKVAVSSDKAPNNDIDIDRDKDTDSDRDKKIDYQKIADLYNCVCVSYPKVKSLSEYRKKTIRARINSGRTYKDFETLFIKAEGSSFLKGGNGRNWQANFDWLIADSNMAKVLDGNYDDRKATQKGLAAISNSGFTALTPEERKRLIAGGKQNSA